jgi:hypothetical protein
MPEQQAFWIIREGGLKSHCIVLPLHSDEQTVKGWLNDYIHIIILTIYSVLLRNKSFRNCQLINSITTVTVLGLYMAINGNKGILKYRKVLYYYNCTIEIPYKLILILVNKINITT